jgi:hypothetical protein
VKNNRFPNLLKPSIIINRYIDGKEVGDYRKFVKTSSAKELQKELGKPA